jgi:hypothetical protein
LIKDDCPIDPKRLVLIDKIAYWDFANKEHHDGQLIVLDTLAPYTVAVLKQMHKKHFPIVKMRLIEHYNGDDDASCDDNNSSAFNDRVIGGKTIKSLHAYGVAIDINPIENPYLVGKEGQQIAYSDRKDQRPGMVEPIVPCFETHGFQWGGDPKHDAYPDYQHFDVPRPLAELLACMPCHDATAFFKDYVANRQLLEKMQDCYAKDHSLAQAYKKNPGAFRIHWKKQKTG